MRSLWRTVRAELDTALFRSIALVCLADGVVGASFGAIAVSGGLPIWLPMLLSVLVFAGAAQFTFVGIVIAGGNPMAAAAAGLLVNARHLPFGFAVSDAVGAGTARRLIGSHLMIDEAVAFTVAQRGFGKRQAAYWSCGALLFVCWNAGVVLGAYGGTMISDTDVLGLDAAFPAVLLALLLPSLSDRRVGLAALAGAAIALLASPFLPAGVPVLLALVGVLVALPVDGADTQRAEDGREVGS